MAFCTSKNSWNSILTTTRRLSRRELAKRAVELQWQRRGAIILLRVSGNSMGSTLPHGSDVQIEFDIAPAVRPGDIVYLRQAETRVIHRLTAAAGPLCLEKGDANRFPRLCLRSSILGKAIGHPKAGEE